MATRLSLDRSMMLAAIESIPRTRNAEYRVARQLLV